MTRNRTVGVLDEVHGLFEAGTFAGLTDRALVERFGRRDGAGSARAFAALVQRHGPMVLRTCRAVLGDAHDAEDAFQVTFLVLARRSGSIANRDSLAAWLRGVAYRTAAYARGAAARRRRHERAAATPADSVQNLTAVDDLAPVVHEEVGRLPEKLRAAVLLCEFEGLSGEDAARRLGCPVGTVKSRLARARERLRGRLARRGFGPAGALAIPAARPVPVALGERTVAAVVGGRSGGLVTAALAAWEAGVLRATLMTRVRALAVVLGVGVVAAATAVVATAQATKGQRRPDQAAAQPEPELKPDQLLDTLARERIEAARRVRDDLYRLYLGGEVPITRYYEAQTRYTEAILAVLDDPRERLALLRTQLKGMKAIESATTQLYKKDQVTRADVELARFHSLDAAIRLAEAESGRRATLLKPLHSDPADAPKATAVFEQFARGQANEELRSLLEKTATLELPANATLSDALKALKAQGTGPFDHGTPIYVDPEGLRKAGVTIETRVNLPKTTGTLGDLFTRVLAPLGLTHAVRDGLLEVRAR